MNKKALTSIILIIIGILLQIISSPIIILNQYKTSLVNDNLFSISYDLCVLSVIFYLIAYLIIRNEKIYYTNKYAALFVMFFPLDAYLQIIISVRLFQVIIIVLTVLFIIIALSYVINYFFGKKINNQLMKDIIRLDDLVKLSGRINSTVIIIYLLSLCVNYVFIEYAVAATIISQVIFYLFLLFLIVYLIIFAIYYFKSRKDE